MPEEGTDSHGLDWEVGEYLGVDCFNACEEHSKARHYLHEEVETENMLRDWGADDERGHIIGVHLGQHTVVLGTKQGLRKLKEHGVHSYCGY